MAYRFSSRMFSVIDDNGDAIAGAKVYTYRSGTSTPLPSYQDEVFSIPNTNPVIADAAGRFPDMFFEAFKYKVILTDADDVTLETIDPIDGRLDFVNTDRLVALNPSDPSPGYLEDKLEEIGMTGASDLDDTVTDTTPVKGGFDMERYQITNGGGCPVENYGIYGESDPRWVDVSANATRMATMMLAEQKIAFGHDTYVFDDTIVIPGQKDVMLIGSGNSHDNLFTDFAGTRLEFIGATTQLAGIYNTSQNALNGSTIMDMVVQWEGPNNIAAIGIYTEAPMHMERVTVNSWRSHAVNYRSDVGVVVGGTWVNVNAQNNVGYGIYIQNNICGLSMENCRGSVNGTWDLVIDIEPAFSSGVTLSEGLFNRAYIKRGWNIKTINANFDALQIDADVVRYCDFDIAYIGGGGLTDNSTYQTYARYRGSAANYNGQVMSNKIDVAASGTFQPGATQLNHQLNVITSTTASDTAVKLPELSRRGEDVTVANFGTDIVKLYPYEGGKINNLAEDAFINIPIGETRVLRCYDTLTGAYWLEIGKG